ncbi:MAG: PEGA domain-containing protein, partial [Bacteroidia bacterium]|nr:PEGA domain-containing protein [Bacteroidia bacterium]
MKNLLLLLLITSLYNTVSAQTAYIQVTGEPGLSVFLNNQFKGKTTVELNGYIIENVTPGKNTIKIVKEGYTPFEEIITVKAGEVLAYKVKPFVKHTVNISQEGNRDETDKKATIETGKLVIQSVPIEIKITIADIEGINNIAKTKDKWMADKIPDGTYKITFTYNQKIINKSIEIRGNDTTSVFINMLSGDFQVKSSLDKKNEIERQEE